MRVVVYFALAVVAFSCSDDDSPTPDSAAGQDAAIDLGRASDAGVGEDQTTLGEAGANDGGPATDGRPADAEHGDSSARANEAGAADGTIDGWVATNQPACNGRIYACSDGVDNDGDQLVDARDPECVGPCDNDEGSFATGISGDNVDGCKQDCFFDGNSGQGEGCEWNLKCDPQNPGANLPKSCPYDPDFKNCPGPQPQRCIDACRPFAPNGCDCFGCCEVFSGGQTFVVYLGSGPSCTADTPQNCAPCTQSSDCVNPCGECELCLGRTVDDLPTHCFSPPSGDGGAGLRDGGLDAGISGDGGARGGGDGGTISGDSGVSADSRTQPYCGDPNLTACFTNNDCTDQRYCLNGCCISGVH